MIAQSFNVNESYPFIYSAEKHIIKDSFRLAILEYNKGYQRALLPRNCSQLYLSLLSKDSLLSSIYFDTLLYYLAMHNENIEWFSGYKLVQKYLASGSPKKYKMAKIENNFICNEFKGQLNRIHEADQFVRNEAMKYVSQKEIYSIEPHKSKIYKVDSINYLKLCHLLQVDSFKSCYNSIFEKHALINHQFKLYSDSNVMSIIKILIKLAEKGYIDKAKLAYNLEHNYNLGGNANSKYKLNPEHFMTGNVFIYQDIEGKDLDSFNQLRKSNNLEPYEDYIAKIIWQRNYGYDKDIVLIPLNIFNMPPDEEFKVINEFTSKKDIKYKVVKFKKPLEWEK